MFPRFLCLLLLLFSLSARAAEPFEIKDGDRVLLLGDTLLERENSYGYLETRMHEQFADRTFTVRNLAFSADTPLGWSRASFDPAAKGFERLKEQIALVAPTVVFLGYGMAASLQEMTDRSGDPTLNPDPARYGAEPMSAARFKRELGQLMEAIVESARAGVPGSTPVPGVGAGVSPERTSETAPPAKRAQSPKNVLEDRAGETPAPTPGTGVLPGTPTAPAVRFVLLSPIRHEDLRATRPGLPDPTEHNKLLDQYSKVIEELAEERGGRFVNLAEPHIGENYGSLTENGIHLAGDGWGLFQESLPIDLGWKYDQTKSPKGWDYYARESLRAAVLRKNALFFHRWRPANSTYLTGFRKHEQGQNAKEISEFDPLITAADAEIDRVKRGGAPAVPGSTPVPGVGAGVPPARTSHDSPTPETVPSPSAVAKVRAGEMPSPARETRALPGTPPPLPAFTIADGYQIELWAENPLLEKPTQMNWDALGRLWVCSSSLYPMIAPGQPAEDKILILSDPDRTGKATKSEVFVDGLLIPTGVVPDLGKADGGRMKDEKQNSDLRPSSLIPQPLYGCYVGQSTELLHFSPSGEKRIVLSGFGTEDTHHILHTLKWGPDGRLYFNQSVYIHSHLETPWGVVRLNSGGLFAYDPRAERVEVFCKGLWNPWGHQFDRWGQSFLTDGAGSSGITWAFPGATFAPFEGGRKFAPSISPGSYPKFCGLELIYSPHFPADWQGNAITCDFRAHRIVRFAITDLAEQKDEGGFEALREVRGAAGTTMKDEQKQAGAPVGTPLPTPADGGQNPSSLILHPSSLPASAGYVTAEQPDLVRTSDATFRPIDVKLGPDGALYVADWSNPIIQHGEVDFRDPRRDHHMGRIWRISQKGAVEVPWEPLVGKGTPELLDGLLSENLWEKEQAQRVMLSRSDGFAASIDGRISEEKVFSSIGLWTAWGVGQMGHGALLKPAKEWTLLRDAFSMLSSSRSPETRALASRYLVALGLQRKAADYTELRSLWADYDVAATAMGAGKRPLISQAELCLEIARNHGINLRPPLMENLLTENDPNWSLVQAADFLEQLSKDPNPRVRLEAMRALARIPTARSAELVLDAAVDAPGAVGSAPGSAGVSPAVVDVSPNTPNVQKPSAAPTTSGVPGETPATAGRTPALPGTGTPGARTPSTVAVPKDSSAPLHDSASLHLNPPDPFLEHAAWLSINDLAKPWTEAIASGAWQIEGHEKQLEFGLAAIDPVLAGDTLAKVLAAGKVELAKGPWIELLGRAGGPRDLSRLLDALLISYGDDCCRGGRDRPAIEPTPFSDADALRAAAALLEAARLRNTRPEGDLALAHFASLAPEPLRASLARLAGLWKAPDALAVLTPLVGDKTVSPALRLAAIDGCRALGGPDAVRSLSSLLSADQSASVRRAALVATAQLDLNAGLSRAAEVFTGLADEAAALATWRDLLQIQRAADALAAKVQSPGWTKNVPPVVLTAGVRAARESGKKGAALLKALAPFTGAEAAQVSLPQDFRAIAERVKSNGNAESGELIYRRAASGCVTCHAIGGAGGVVGPSLTSIGASAPLDYLIESLLVPNAKVKEGYNAVTLKLKDGTEATGIQARETPQEIFLRNIAGQETAVVKANVTGKTDIGSIMPAGLVDALTDRERLDLYAFLSELGKPGPYDASKGNVARLWRLYPASAQAAALKTDTADFPPAACTLVDGRLLKDQLAEALQLVTNPGEAIYASAQFQLATGGPTALKIIGAEKAWIDGQPVGLAAADSAPNLPAGVHTLTVQLSPAQFPAHLRAEAPAARFLGN